MALQDVIFGGLAAAEIPERVPFQQAVVCADCILDRGQIEGRTAYRDVLAGIAVGAGQPQLIARFRPSNTSARTVVVRAGQVHIVKDPTSLTASDGTAYSLGTPFGSTANISGAQLNDSYYLGTDESGVAMQRIKWDSTLGDVDGAYSLESLGALPQGAKPTATQSGALTWTAFTTITPTYGGTIIVQTNGNTGWASMASTWRGFSATNNGNDDPITGAYAQYKLAADFDATGYNWLAVVVSPHDEGGIAGNRRIGIYVAVDVAGSPGTYTQVGSIWDTPKQNGSPNVVSCYLAGLSAATLSAIRYIKFQVDGPSGGKFATYGYMFLPSPPVTVNGKQTYYVDCYNASTGQASALTAALDVTTSDPIVSSYPNSYMANDGILSTGGNDNLFPPTNPFVFTGGVTGIPVPSLQDVGALITIRQVLPVTWIATLILRLWKQTENGIQLVVSHTITAGDVATGYVDLVDPGGLSVLRNQIYKAGGVPPRCNALASFAGRLNAGYQNRDYNSSFTPTSDTSNPFPQFPDVPIETADGWSFDLASKAEQIISIMAGDIVYLMTNYGMRALTDTDAPLFGAPSIFHVGEFGITSRNGAIFAEDGRLFWGSYKGVYVGQGRVEPVEMSQSIRQYIIDTFQPDSTVVMGYQSRCLYLFKGTLGLRYSFLTQKWSTFTTSHSVSRCVSWSETITAAVFGENMWILTSANRVARWQDTVSRDLQVGTDTTTGSDIRNWSFSTGFHRQGTPVKVVRFSSDISGGEVRTYVARDMTGDPEREVLLQEGEHVYECPPDIYAYKLRLRLEGPNTAKVRRLFWQLEQLDGSISPP